MVHVSVQLFSNKTLAEKVVREQNLLHVMVKVLHDMIRPSLVTFRRGGMASFTDLDWAFYGIYLRALIWEPRWPLVV